ncbi:MAG: hypothetical protein WCR04_05055, partial [Fibrobacteraceae bacterium]
RKPSARTKSRPLAIDDPYSGLWKIKQSNDSKIPDHSGIFYLEASPPKWKKTLFLKAGNASYYLLWDYGG